MAQTILRFILAFGILSSFSVYAAGKKVIICDGESCIEVYEDDPRAIEYAKKTSAEKLMGDLGLGIFRTDKARSSKVAESRETREKVKPTLEESGNHGGSSLVPEFNSLKNARRIAAELTGSEKAFNENFKDIKAAFTEQKLFEKKFRPSVENEISANLALLICRNLENSDIEEGVMSKRPVEPCADRESISGAQIKSFLEDLDVERLNTTDKQWLLLVTAANREKQGTDSVKEKVAKNSEQKEPSNNPWKNTKSEGFNPFKGEKRNEVAIAETEQPYSPLADLSPEQAKKIWRRALTPETRQSVDKSRFLTEEVEDALNRFHTLKPGSAAWVNNLKDLSDLRKKGLQMSDTDIQNAAIVASQFKPAEQRENIGTLVDLNLKLERDTQYDPTIDPTINKSDRPIALKVMSDRIKANPSAKELAAGLGSTENYAYTLSRELEDPQSPKAIARAAKIYHELQQDPTRLAETLKNLKGKSGSAAETLRAALTANTATDKTDFQKQVLAQAGVLQKQIPFYRMLRDVNVGEQNGAIQPVNPFVRDNFRKGFDPKAVSGYVMKYIDPKANLAYVRNNPETAQRLSDYAAKALMMYANYDASGASTVQFVDPTGNGKPVVVRFAHTPKPTEVKSALEKALANPELKSYVLSTKPVDPTDWFKDIKDEFKRRASF